MMESIEQCLTQIGQHLFLIFGILALAGATAMVAAKNAVHSVVGFLLCMVALSGCYLSLEAEFMGVAQLLVYAGGIVVLFLFVVMLVELSKAKDKKVFQRQILPATLAVVSVVGLFIGLFWQTLFGPSATQGLTPSPGLVQSGQSLGHAQVFSRELFAKFLLPFEILSVILLVALVAAVVLAKKERV